jgi:hypothetical protein
MADGAGGAGVKGRGWFATLLTAIAGRGVLGARDVLSVSPRDFRVPFSPTEPMSYHDLNLWFYNMLNHKDVEQRSNQPPERLP